MSEQAPDKPPDLQPQPPKPRRPKIPWRRIMASLIVRVYALIILGVLCLAGYMAVAYLERSVFRPTQIPPQLLQWQGNLNAAALRQDNIPGVTGPAARAPLGHYHGVERWFQQDSANTCTTSGCHSPLPHTARVRVAAFANFHTTFLRCTMCHQDAAPGAAVSWVDNNTGQTRDTPAILRLVRYLDERHDRLADDPAGAHAEVVDLLQQTLSASGDDVVLGQLLVQLQTSAPGGPVWRHAIDVLTTELPLHARGEYGAKLAFAGERSSQAEQLLATQTQSFLACLPDDSEHRRQIQQTIHQPLLKEPRSCLACHDQTPLVDFQALGYSPKRGAALRQLPLAHLMQQIRQGDRFYIPRLLEGNP